MNVSINDLINAAEQADITGTLYSLFNPNPNPKQSPTVIRSDSKMLFNQTNMHVNSDKENKDLNLRVGQGQNENRLFGHSSSSFAALELGKSVVVDQGFKKTKAFPIKSIPLPLSQEHLLELQYARNIRTRGHFCIDCDRPLRIKMTLSKRCCSCLNAICHNCSANCDSCTICKTTICNKCRSQSLWHQVFKACKRQPMSLIFCREVSEDEEDKQSCCYYYHLAECDACLQYEGTVGSRNIS